MSTIHRTHTPSTRTNAARPGRTARGTWPMRALAACTALAVGMSALAVQAQPRDHRDSPPHQAQRHPGPPPQAHRPGPPPQAHRPGPPPQMHRPGPPSHAYRPGPPPFAQGPGRGVGPDHRWHRGDRMPPAYRTHHYVVNDWRGHHLYAPPRGYHWVQYGSDYILVAIATGLIAQIILSQ